MSFEGKKRSWFGWNGGSDILIIMVSFLKNGFLLDRFENI